MRMYRSVKFQHKKEQTYLPWNILCTHGLGIRDFIPGRGKRFFSSSKHPEQLWGPPSLLFNVYKGTFFGGKVVEV
jgi:hypothetical protein